MCSTCGCGHGHTRIAGRAVPAMPLAASGPIGYRPVNEAPTATGCGHASHAPGVSADRRVRIERDILASNDAIAAGIRARLASRRIFAVNLMSSPGSGKTTLLCETILRLRGRLPVAVIEGDQETSFDADRIRATGAPALQVNTGKGCHLDAHMVDLALDRLQPADSTVLMIENVGNLVCPAGFDLGEAARVVVLSVTEGEDKPLKYPDMFASASLMILNKADLLPHLRFDVQRCIDFARRVNPGLPVMLLSATGGQGMEAWLEWIEAGVAGAGVTEGVAAHAGTRPAEVLRA